MHLTGPPRRRVHSSPPRTLSPSLCDSWPFLRFVSSIGMHRIITSGVRKRRGANVSAPPAPLPAKARPPAMRSSARHGRMQFKSGASATKPRQAREMAASEESVVQQQRKPTKSPERKV